MSERFGGRGARGFSSFGGSRGNRYGINQWCGQSDRGTPQGSRGYGAQRDAAYRGRRGPILGYKRLRQLNMKSPDEITNELLQCRDSFEALVNSEEINDDWIFLLAHILAEMCRSRMSENVNQLLSILKGSSFLRQHLTSYILSIPLEGSFDEEELRILLQSLIFLFKEWLKKFPRSCFDIPLDSLSGILKNVQCDLDLSGYIKEVESLMEERIKAMQKQRKQEKKIFPKENEPEPPNDFRGIPVEPTSEEINSNDAPFLRRNRVKGKYDDLDHYLDVQFRLLREDFVAPLREGIRELSVAEKPGGKQSHDLYIYTGVRVLNPVCTNAGIVHSISFDTKNTRKIPWEHSKRLLYGSFLCLSKDNFKTMFFATVANRKPEMLRKGNLEIRFIDGLEGLQKARVRPYDTFQLVESPAYFESYRHVLRSLKEITPESLPFQKYLVHCDPDVDPPEYLRNPNAEGPVCYDLREVLGVPEMDEAANISVLQEQAWPDAENVELNESQLEALKSALTKEFAVIQGPPGTGKTYVGLKVVRALLENRHAWDPEKTSCMLMVCYTNHALDQFLEGVLTFQSSGIIRVGGRSGSEKLERFNLHELTRSSDGRYRVYSDMRDQREALEKASGLLDQSRRRILTDDELKDFIALTHIQQLRKAGYHYQARGVTAVEGWLGLTRTLKIPKSSNKTSEPYISQRSELNTDPNDEDNIQVDNDADIIENQRYIGNEFDAFKQSLDHNNTRRGGTWREYQGVVLSEQERKIISGNSAIRPMSQLQACKVQNVCNLDGNQRWSLYLLWLHLFQSRSKEEINQRTTGYERAAVQLTEVQNSDELRVLKEATVIGMTTTGAAKYRMILEQIQPRVVVVEEAAEVLEAHVITSLTQGTKHLVLIGDHKQLRPNPTWYKLAIEYNLNVSLFERMVNGGMKCDLLNTQHRMRPQISYLLRHIYDDLQDHESVMHYPDIEGVRHNIFFINHNYPEDESEVNSRLKSHSNKHEAGYVVALCEYFLLQGYNPEQITVLTMYTGQLLTMRTMMPKERFEGVRVTAVDNFQGEENDIILLSLVRSNKEKKIGFLGIQNRICVALSRARSGFFCIGNFVLLAEKSDLWKKIVDDMDSCDAIGERLELFCRNHPEKIIYATSAEDFLQAPEGGCIQPCQFQLECGHCCERVCHPVDLEHAQYRCRKDCLSEICADHETRCESKCHYGEPCKKCHVQVLKVIPPCSHTQLVPCGTSPEDFQCQEDCETVFDCSHSCPGKCSDDCKPSECKVEVERVLDCRHVVTKECSVLSQDDYSCQEPCDITLECEHACKGTCSSCKQGRMHIPCEEPCDRDLVCLHHCKEPCTKNCPPCAESCQNRCHHSRCPKKCRIPCVPCKELCYWSCDPRCPNKYRCSKLCGEKCNRPRCDRPCTKRLPCKHKCIGLCGEPCPKLCRVCNKDEVTDIFFGNENEPGAIFIELFDCGHVFEVPAMDNWMDLSMGNEEGEDESIQLKCCPRCKTPIRCSYRYADVVKAKLADIENVKKMLHEEEQDLKRTMETLAQTLEKLAKKYPAIKDEPFSGIVNLVQEDTVMDQDDDYYASQARTGLWRYNSLRSNPDSCFSIFRRWLQKRHTMAELGTINNQIRLLEGICQLNEKALKDIAKSGILSVYSHRSRILGAFSNRRSEGDYFRVESSSSSEDIELVRQKERALVEIESELANLLESLVVSQISTQELEDVRDEITRIGLLLALRNLQSELTKEKDAACLVDEQTLQKIERQLTRRLQEEEATDIETNLVKIRKQANLSTLSNEERIMVVTAMGFSKGHWYKCPNGHIYAISDCGRPMEEAKCPRCNEMIGGRSHQLASGNQSAAEMESDWCAMEADYMYTDY